MLNYTKKHVNTITICVTLVICVILLICLDVLVFNAPKRINNQNNFARFSRIDKTDGVSRKYGNNNIFNRTSGGSSYIHCCDLEGPRCLYVYHPGVVHYYPDKLDELVGCPDCLCGRLHRLYRQQPVCTCHRSCVRRTDGIVGMR